jgi:hypothetical protein
MKRLGRLVELSLLPRGVVTHLPKLNCLDLEGRYKDRRYAQSSRLVPTDTLVPYISFTGLMHVGFSRFAQPSTIQASQNVCVATVPA